MGNSHNHQLRVERHQHAHGRDHAHDPAHQHHDDKHGHHGHHHNIVPRDFSSALAWGIAINSIFVVVEFGFGFVAHSTALMADAGHNLFDVLGLALALVAAVLAKRSPTARYTYGLRSFSIVAALGNAVLLLVACGAIGFEALQRLAQPPAVNSGIVMAVAGAGIVVNGATALLLARGSAHDLNMRGAYLHMLADAAVSLGVVLAAALTLYTGWLWPDPLVSVAIVGVIVWGTWSLLRQSLHLALQAVPAHVSTEKVHNFLLQQEGVSEVRDLHIWAMSTTETALTAHLVMPQGAPSDQALSAIAQALRSEHGIQHSTLQVGRGELAHACSLKI